MFSRPPIIRSAGGRVKCREEGPAPGKSKLSPSGAPSARPLSTMPKLSLARLLSPLLLLGLLALLALPAGAQRNDRRREGEPLPWPPVKQEAKPWTRWWWLGSALDEAEITRQLELFEKAGLGGVEISPIYGTRGSEERQVSYLTPRWNSLLAHTTREAARLGMGVDMIQGTGWPFGGPWVPPTDVAQKVVLTPIPIDARGQLTARLQAGAPLLSLMAFSAAGEVMDITGRVDSVGRLDWTPPPGMWTLYGVQIAPTGQQVKRSGPGGEGPVVDPFSREASERYFAHFDPLVRGLPDTSRVRAVFNDSFEAFGANWTGDLFSEFQRRRGYDLRRELPALVGRDTPDRVMRVRHDYRQTVSEVLLDDFARPWSDWAKGNRSLTRLQAHGSPGNVLDLYAAADIPETEMFGPGRRETTGVRTPDQPAPPAPFTDLVASKLASSAAHVAGKPLVSSESMTWLSEHFQTSLADMKGQADSLFVAGVNHLFYHGTPSSPANAEWPGWLFYASTDVTPTNTWWRDFPTLNQYITRVQSFLQAGRPDNDVLVYFPVHELWNKEEGARDLLQYITIHNGDSWLEKNQPELAAAVRHLWERGYGFDFVSDAQLAGTVNTANGRLKANDASYRTLLVAGSPSMPPATFNRILQLAREGATVLFLGDLPRDVPGWGNLEGRRAQLKEELAKLKPERKGENLQQAEVGKGKLWIGKNPGPLLQAVQLPREELVDRGLQFIRRAQGRETIYFLAHRGDKPVDGWVPLAAADQGHAAFYDPMTGRTGVAETRRRNDRLEVYLQLRPGESILVRTLDKAPERPDPWRYTESAGEELVLTGDWEVEFTAGGPSLPKPARVRDLKSWTTWAEDAAALRAFSGTARYRLSFDLPKAGSSRLWSLELGQVYHSARVRLNAADLGTLVAPPYRLVIPDRLLRPGKNELEVEVTNLMGNRIAEMDRQRVPWQKFYFVNIQYKPFTAAEWAPASSGLVGPVRLIPLKRQRPD